MGKYSEGDKVVSVKDTQDIPEGFIGFVVETGQECFEYTVMSKEGKSECFHEHELELLSVSSSIAKPILEERKVGKVRMELFDEGFPNAILEVAKVMTWANECKGYKDHDWKQLPDADTAFSAAASRHKVKGFIQKVLGISALDRTDEESHIVHLAHQAFNVLAELELVLTGKIK